MNELDNMKKIWLNQAFEPVEVDPGKTTRLPSSLEKKLRLFEQENSYKNFLVVAVFMAVMGILFLISVIRQQEPGGLPAVCGFLGASGLFFWYYRRSRQLAIHSSSPAASVRHYIRAKYEQLGIFVNMRFFQVLCGLLIGLGFFLMEGDEPFANLDQRTIIGLAAFAVLVVFLLVVLQWWYRHHHPYRPTELRRQLKAILEEFEQTDR